MCDSLKNSAETVLSLNDFRDVNFFRLLKSYFITAILVCQELITKTKVSCTVKPLYPSVYLKTTCFRYFRKQVVYLKDYLFASTVLPTAARSEPAFVEGKSQV